MIYYLVQFYSSIRLSFVVIRFISLIKNICIYPFKYGAEFQNHHNPVQNEKMSGSERISMRKHKNGIFLAFIRSPASLVRYVSAGGVPIESCIHIVLCLLLLRIEPWQGQFCFLSYKLKGN